MKYLDRKGAADVLIGLMLLLVVGAVLGGMQMSSSLRMRSKTAQYNSLAGFYTAEVGIIYSYVRIVVNGNTPAVSGSGGYSVPIQSELPPHAWNQILEWLIPSAYAGDERESESPRTRVDQNIPIGGAPDTYPLGTPVMGTRTLKESTSGSFLPRFQNDSVTFQMSPDGSANKFFCGTWDYPGTSGSRSLCFQQTQLAAAPTAQIDVAVAADGPWAPAVNVAAGAEGFYRWSSTNTASCSLSPVSGSGTSKAPTTTGALSASLTLVLTCTGNDESTVTASATITVDSAPAPANENLIGFNMAAPTNLTARYINQNDILLTWNDNQRAGTIMPPNGPGTYPDGIELPNETFYAIGQYTAPRNLWGYTVDLLGMGGIPALQGSGGWSNANFLIAYAPADSTSYVVRAPPWRRSATDGSIISPVTFQVRVAPVYCNPAAMGMPLYPCSGVGVPQEQVRRAPVFTPSRPQRMRTASNDFTPLLEYRVTGEPSNIATTGVPGPPPTKLSSATNMVVTSNSATQKTITWTEPHWEFTQFTRVYVEERTTTTNTRIVTLNISPRQTNSYVFRNVRPNCTYVFGVMPTGIPGIQNANVIWSGPSFPPPR